MEKKFINLKESALAILKERYLLKKNGEVVESPEELFQRVSKAVAEGELSFGGTSQAEFYQEKFYQVMANLDFLPNSPTLMNAGTPLGQLSACFVLPIEDSLASIFEALKQAALIHKSGGGTGFSFSKIRPKGDMVASTQGIASGPLSFIQVFDAATEAIKQGGKRRGANMGVLRVDHPDIEEFIEIKFKNPEALRNFNLSVGLTDAFMEAVRKEEKFPLVNPRNKKITKHVDAKELFEKISYFAWASGDPGVLFLDTINRHNPTPHLGEIEATNPCGEQPLLPFESCNLGSINLANFVKDQKIDWEKLKDVVWLAVRFLDDVIEVNRFPLPQITKITRLTRKIGLGVMGFADMLIKLGVSYAEKEALEIAEKLMSFIERESVKASHHLAKERGCFPAFYGSFWDKINLPMRNATTTTIAPTGSISLIAGVSPGIEPLFGVYYERKTLENKILKGFHPLFLEVLGKAGYKENEINEILSEVKKVGLLKYVKISENIKRLFVTTYEVSPETQLLVQAAFQRHTHNAVSKTINLPPNTTVEEIKKIYLKAYELGLKGVTVYRYGCKKEQVIYLGEDNPEGLGCLVCDLSLR